RPPGRAKVPASPADRAVGNERPAGTPAGQPAFVMVQEPVVLGVDRVSAAVSMFLGLHLIQPGTHALVVLTESRRGGMRPTTSPVEANRGPRGARSGLAWRGPPRLRVPGSGSGPTHRSHRSCAPYRPGCRL